VILAGIEKKPSAGRAGLDSLESGRGEQSRRRIHDSQAQGRRTGGIERDLPPKRGSPGAAESGGPSRFYQGTGQRREIGCPRRLGLYPGPKDPLEQPAQAPQPAQLGSGSRGGEPPRLRPGENPGGFAEPDRVAKPDEVVPPFGDRPIVDRVDEVERRMPAGELELVGLRHSRSIAANAYHHQ
jgi:hypothetical protein